MKSKLILFIAVLALLVSACDLEPKAGSSAPERTALRDDDNINAYNKALSQGNSAANLAQKAKTETEWKAVASEWNLAIATLKSVSKNDPNYAQAQQKIVEYQKNLDVAQKKTKAASSPK